MNKTDQDLNIGKKERKACQGEHTACLAPLWTEWDKKTHYLTLWCQGVRNYSGRLCVWRGMGER